jgi:serine/threonine-protein kinase
MDEHQDATGPPPRLKGRYRLVEWLGQGGMGAVYRARDETLDRDVAIKLLRPDRLAQGEAGARFLREARLVARLAHPNIMMLYDADQHDIWRYLVLEYIPGQDLERLLAERPGPLPLADALQIIRAVLQALAYAHGQGVIHRDIKPGNVMVTPAGQVKVTDFGLSLAQGETRLTRDDVVFGTVLYLAPELIDGAPSGVSSDLYAAGAVFYELLAGRPLFIADNPALLLPQILNAPVIPPHTLNPHIPPEVEQVMLKLLAKNPAGRYPSAEEALAALAVPAGIERRARPEIVPIAGPEPLLAEALLRYAAAEDTAAAVEAERRRLAELLQGQVIESLNLLLSQANAYEQSLAPTPPARMAVSVLASLIRQALQQVRDLEAGLKPALLETLGLEPALELLASQAVRSHGLQIGLTLARLPERPPPQIELALFRAAQAGLERAVSLARATQAAIQLDYQAGRLVFKLADNGAALIGSGLAMQAVQRRVEQLGGLFESYHPPHGGFEVAISFPLTRPVRLTQREMEVIQLLAEGLTNKEIARRLSLKPRTVNFHLDNIYSKLGVNSRTEAAIYALRQGWVRPAGDPV